MDILSLLSKLVDADKLAGWVRAGTASLLTIAIAHWAPLGDILSQDTRTALGVGISGVVVGIWSQLTKSNAAKIAMAADVPGVKQVVVTSPAVADSIPSEKVVAK